MMVDLWRRNLLFTTKTHSTNSSSCHGGDKQHNKEVDGRMHSRDAKIAYLVREHLQTKEKTRMRERE